MRCSKRILPLAIRAAELATGLPVLSMASPTKPTSDGQRDGFGEAHEFLLIAFDEGGAFDEILRGVAADAEFGKDGEFGAAGLGFGGEFEDAFGIAFEVADGGVELG